ncbi:ribbon-helix-helix domain-containing protein [Candidatus Igneacidithiobacillus taiwanensis]|uniref:ribbon-helix-helix domain-containing protein n=1 Tax=Candidatus Igneacidithiobacillus taiwanensis TaxID=1945924 RepID=UPI0028A08EED|nr:ribbon-helix-helix domain-containing protein [Candidatus Igneacidithiobacillus taiwanensis]
MAKVKTQGALSAALQQTAAPATAPARRRKAGTVLIGAHYAPEVRRALKMLEAKTDRRLNELLGEAINDLCTKYGMPAPWSPTNGQD